MFSSSCVFIFKYESMYFYAFFFYLILLELIIFFLNQMLAWHADVVFLLLFY